VWGGGSVPVHGVGGGQRPRPWCGGVGRNGRHIYLWRGARSRGAHGRARAQAWQGARAGTEHGGARPRARSTARRRKEKHSYANDSDTRCHATPLQAELHGNDMAGNHPHNARGTGGERQEKKRYCRRHTQLSSYARSQNKKRTKKKRHSIINAHVRAGTRPAAPINRVRKSVSVARPHRPGRVSAGAPLGSHCVGALPAPTETASDLPPATP